MRNQIILTILLIGLSTQQCTIGCQVCTTNNVCTVCDIVNNYYLTNNTCTLSAATNCLVRAQNGNCAFCKSGFYVDSNTNQCLAVATASIVANCIGYSSGQACVLCTSGQYIAAGVCKAATTVIAGCNYYSDNGVCAQCNTGFIFAVDLLNCVAIPANSNCLFYTFVNCDKCNIGYTLNPNNYANVWNVPANQNGLLQNLILKSNYWMQLSVCQANFAQNCLTQNKFNECINCLPGYYFSNKLCVAYPLPTIYGCVVYTTAATCAECQKGMYVRGPTECVNNIPIDRCLVYSPTTVITTCTQCNTTHFLNGNACSQRSVSVAILNCKETTVNADNCATCLEGFILTGDNLACLSQVNNCLTYAPSTVNTNNLQCSSCKVGYYLTISGNVIVCTLGTVANCDTYYTGGEVANQNQCFLCKNGFYLSNNVCIAHNAIDNCDVFSQTTANVCSFCKLGFYSFSLTTVCVATTVLSGCDKYSVDGLSCILCAKTYYSVGSTCVLIPSGFSNCLIFDGAACTKCDTNFMVNELNPPGTCVALPDYITQGTTATAFCNSIRTEVNQVATWNQFPTRSDYNVAAAQNFFPLSCENCFETYYPYRPSAIESVCVNANQLGLYAGFGTRDTHCKRYGISFASKDIVCLECIAGYFITNYHLRAHLTLPKTVNNPNGITCVLGCALTQTTWAAGPVIVRSNVIIQDDLLGSVNICIPAFSTDAASASHFIRVISSNNLYQCTRAARRRFVNIAVPTADTYSNDFVCYSSFVANPATKPVNHHWVLAMNNDAITQSTDQTNTFYQTLMYGVEKTDLTIPVNYDSSLDNTSFRNDFNVPFGVLDTGISVPVFNYKGIHQSFAVVEVLNNLVTAGVAGRIKTFDNCDLFYQYKSTGSAIGYAFSPSLLYNKQTAPAAPANNFEICLRCSFGYALAYSTPATGSTAANNPAFPSCSDAKMTGCTSSVVYGGLSTFLNSVISCHQCAVGTYPTIYVETRAFAGVTNGYDANALSTFVGWRIFGVYATVTTLTANNQNAFGCVAIAANQAVFNADITTTTSFTNCAAFAYVTPITDNMVTVQGGAYAGMTAPNTNPICIACKGNFFPVYLKQDAIASNTGTNDAQGKLPGWAVTQCKPSLNCDAASTVVNQFNACAKCRVDQDGIVPPTYYAFRDALLTECYVSLSQNCFILKADTTKAGSNNKCLACKAGFFLNVDDLCESITIPNISPTGTFSRPFLFNFIFDSSIKTFAFKTVTDGVTDAVYKINLPTDNINFKLAYFIRIHYLLSASGASYGASDCNAGWVLAPPAFLAGSLCVGSSYLKANQLITNTKFVKNCANYRGEILSDTLAAATWKSFPYFQSASWNKLTTATDELRGLYCQYCKTGYVLKNEQNECVLEGGIQNCLYLRAGNTQCQTCKVGFLNKDGACVNEVIAGCSKYQNTVTYNAGVAGLKCATCADTFYLPTLATTCVAGTIANCLNYLTNSAIVCTNCKPGYAVLSVLIGVVASSYCYPIPATYNCQSWQGTSQDSGINYATFSCSKCNQGTAGIFGVRPYDYLPTLVPTTKCLPFVAIANCIQYNQGDIVITKNDFQCSKCATTHWLQASSKTCIARVNNSLNCSIFNANADTCTTCKRGWYLSADATNCVAYPDGIYGCRIYSDRVTCTQCNTGFYLFSNKCIPSTIVASCDVYSGNWTCSACANGFFLLNATQCVVPEATNCAEVASMKACKNCPPNNGLKSANGVTSCVSNAISNCAVSTFVDPFVCTVCNAGFWVNVNGTCSVVTTLITGCSVYDSATTCLTCINTGILNVARTSCDSIKYLTYMDAQCLSSKLLANPVCSQCPLGSYFTDKVCTLCPNNALSFGCLSCNPVDPTICLICTSGYYMNQAGVCIRNNNVPENPTPQVPSPTSSIALTRAVAFTVGLAALYFDEL